MEQDKFALVERILKDVANILKKDANLYAFDIVPVENNYQNKSPVLHLENCLGLESWCVKHVYMHCYTELMDKFFNKRKQKVLKVCAVNAERLTDLLNVTLLLNPELTMLWNKRRELAMKCLLDKSSEMRFTKLVLSRKPKCNDAFSYRRWILDLIFQDDFLENNNIQNLINEELQICDITSDKNPNNYHSWSHRMWFMKKLRDLQNQFNMFLLYIKEYDNSELWMNKHVSDYSCFHYRQFCIKNIFSICDTDQWKLFERSANLELRKCLFQTLISHLPKDITIDFSHQDMSQFRDENLVGLIFSSSFRSCSCIVNYYDVCKKLELLFYELTANTELIHFFTSHETLWYHRRFIIHEILTVMYDYYGLVRHDGVLVKNNCKKCHTHEQREKQVKIVRYDGSKMYNCILFRSLSVHEKTFCDEKRLQNDLYSERHEKYLKFIEGMKL